MVNHFFIRTQHGWMRFLLIACLVMLSFVTMTSRVEIAHAANCTLQNPIVSAGQDPSVWYANGLYYLVQTGEPDENSIWIRAAATLVVTAIFFWHTLHEKTTTYRHRLGPA